MQLFKVTYYLKSPLALGSDGDDPWAADTIFGHLCWALRYLDGESNLAAFLDFYPEDCPPLLVSNGFPGDLLPRPILPARPRPGKGKAEDIQLARTQKEARQTAWLSLEEFGRAISGEQFIPAAKDPSAAGVRRITFKNQINRSTGTTGGEGNLFDLAEVFYRSVSIYARVDEGFVDDAWRLFDFVAQQGYGKRKSAGYGEVDASSFSFERFDGFGSPAEPNGFVSLANFVPASADPTSGTWRSSVKYGKLGEAYALHEHPFKRPLLMMTAGSSFYDSPIRECYGRLVRGVSASHPEVVQYGLAFPVPARLPEKETR